MEEKSLKINEKFKTCTSYSQVVSFCALNYQIEQYWHKKDNI